MKELLYFAFADLMAGIDYCPATGTLRYASHRRLSRDEQSVVEQYLSEDFTTSCRPHGCRPVSVVYHGIDSRLIKSLQSFHAKNDQHNLTRTEVCDAVNELISRSMQKYYFEQIGDAILSARHDASDPEAESAAERRKRQLKLEELVRAYNIHASKKVTVDEVIPIELKSRFGIPATTCPAQNRHAVPAVASIALAK